MAVRIINLEAGKPLVAAALVRLDMELSRAKRERLTAVKLIHGYGSHGTGGRIKEEVHRVLAQKRSRKAIKQFIPGEQWTMFNPEATAATVACPELYQDCDKERSNSGITIVIL